MFCCNTQLCNGDTVGPKQILETSALPWDHLNFIASEVCNMPRSRIWMPEGSFLPWHYYVDGGCPVAGLQEPAPICCDKSRVQHGQCSSGGPPAKCRCRGRGGGFFSHLPTVPALTQEEEEGEGMPHPKDAALWCNLKRRRSALLHWALSWKAAVLLLVTALGFVG